MGLEGKKKNKELQEVLRKKIAYPSFSTILVSEGSRKKISMYT
jgi:hypothetical protein